MAWLTALFLLILGISGKSAKLDGLELLKIQLEDEDGVTITHPGDPLPPPPERRPQKAGFTPPPAHLVGNGKSVNEVFVYQYITFHWGKGYNGYQDCPTLPNMHCHWTWSDHLRQLRRSLIDDRKNAQKRHDSMNIVANNSVSIAVYNIHTLWEKKREHFPAVCELRTNLSIVESEESRVRYAALFNPSFKNFDGYSTTHPSSSIQRIYMESYLNESEFLSPLKPFSKLIKGASYVASDCHKRDAANANRDGNVVNIRNAGFRVDGLGRCLHTPPDATPEKIGLPKTPDTRYNLVLKREAISNYMFNLAFENSVEDGYVTEKPFDAMLSGTVPIYLGDAKTLKKTVPHPKAVIFLEDFEGNAEKLAKYLTYLSTNETAYEEHRNWRKTYSLKNHVKGNEMMEPNWMCKICQWALENQYAHHKRVRHCALDDDSYDSSSGASGFEKIDPKRYNGKVVRSQGREVYFVEEGTLRLIPSLSTFFAMGMKLEEIIQISNREFQNMQQGQPMPHKD